MMGWHPKTWGFAARLCYILCFKSHVFETSFWPYLRLGKIQFELFTSLVLPLIGVVVSCCRFLWIEFRFYMTDMTIASAETWSSNTKHCRYLYFFPKIIFMNLFTSNNNKTVGSNRDIFWLLTLFKIRSRWERHSGAKLQFFLSWFFF